MKKNLILIILIIMPTLSYAENKNYFQFEYGKSKLDSGISATAGTPSIDEKDKSFGITYGYNLKNSNTFLEFGYIDLGSYSVKLKDGDAIITNHGDTEGPGVVKTIGTEATSFKIGIKQDLYNSEQLEISGRIGIHSYRSIHTQTDAAGTTTLLDEADKKYYGLGASYNFGDFKTNLNYTYYDIDTRSTFLEDVTTITVGLSYKKEF
jgi:hypothetical protein